MSALDKELLSLAELKPAGVARVLGRSRQTISNSLDEEADYFSAGEVVLILNDARRRDVSGLEALVNLVEDNYKLGSAPRHAKQRDAHPERDSRDLMLSYLCGHEQVLEAAQKAEVVCVLCNESRAHLTPGALFSRLVRGLVEANLANLEFVVPSERVASTLFEVLRTSSSQLKMKIGAARGVPCILCRPARTSMRGFVIARFAIEEILHEDAEALWWSTRKHVGATGIFEKRQIIS